MARPCAGPRPRSQGASLVRTLRLEQRWVEETGTAHGGFRFRLWNLSGRPLVPAAFCYASMTRLTDAATVSGGWVARKLGSHVEIAFDPRPTLAPGAPLDLVVEGLAHAPTNRTQGAMAAWIVEADGTPVEAEVGDLQPPPGRARGPIRDWPEGDPGAGLGLLPWPAAVEVADLGPAPLLRPAPSADPAPFAAVTALHRRLFPVAPAPFTLDPDARATPVEIAPGGHPAGGYALAFGSTIILSHTDADGLRHGLVTLAQMAHAARTNPRFRFAGSGRIVDAPRHGWRGAHLDVARNFRPIRDVLRLIDVLAWHKMNRLHWHLSDDEGYRLPSRAHPALNDVGARRGGDAPLPPQYADGPGGQAGHYTRDEVEATCAHAAALGVEIVPEIDMPGHVASILAAIPELADPEEPHDSYRSVQGYPNNALNPASERTYAVVEALVDELCDMFPGPVLHVGGDEVDHGAWRRSPIASTLADRLGVMGAMPLQSHFLRRVQRMIHVRGRLMGGWDECALGGGIVSDRTILMAWQNVETTRRLIAEGYDVVATPGQAYYLDMVQGGGWDAAGTSWAGPVEARACYDHEAAEDAPTGPGHLLGVQACIWSEHINTRERFNEMVFPRLSAVAEAAWTPKPAKNWPRFTALSRLMPML